MNDTLKAQLRGWAEIYNDRQYFQEDPIIFPTRFSELKNEEKRLSKMWKLRPFSPLISLGDAGP